ncbi:MAG: hypothetical protein ABSE49_34605 [Polyangiaceae bacterium]
MELANGSVKLSTDPAMLARGRVTLAMDCAMLLVASTSSAGRGGGGGSAIPRARAMA